jgi:hypothetical protein
MEAISMGKVIAVVGGPGSGKSRWLREAFFKYEGTAKFLECRHTPENISYIFNDLPDTKQVVYLESLDMAPVHMNSDIKALFIDAPGETLCQVLAMVAQAYIYDLTIYIPIRVSPNGDIPYKKFLEAHDNVEFLKIE